MNKQIFIIASGASIRQGLWDTPIEYLPIWQALKEKTVISVNWSYKWIVPTVALFCDYKFYVNEKEGLDKLPLVVGKEDAFYADVGRYLEHFDFLPKNLYFLKHSTGKNINNKGMRTVYYGKEAWSKGFYSSQLSGMYALNLAIALDYKEIYLLGYDATEIEGYTHFYEPEGIGILKWNGRETSGVGKNERKEYKTGTYNNDINWWFEPFKPELNYIKIYNVSPKSKLDIFPKITYEYFYKKINSETENQEEIRNFIISKIKEQK